jgi:uncharacterized protein YraI
MARFFRRWLLLGCLLPTAGVAQTAYTANTANLRAGPSRDFPVVTSVGSGAPLQVVGCVDDWTWCDVVVGADRGWMYAGNLVYPYEGRRVAIISGGPLIGLPIVTFSVGPYWDSYYRTRPWYGRRSYWMGRPLPPHWVGAPGPRPPRPSALAPRPRPPGLRPHASRPPGPPGRPHRPGPARPGPRPGIGPHAGGP